MNDVELDVAIELLVDPEFQEAWDNNKHNRYWVSDCLPRYTQSWGLLMPLVVEHHITLEIFEDGSGRAGQYFEHKNSRHSTASANPQRSAAECLLKVLVDK